MAQLPRFRATPLASPTKMLQGTPYLFRLLRDLGIDAAPHGFRSSFQGWAAECTEAPREVCELALAHVNSDRVEAAATYSSVAASSCSIGPIA